MVFAVQCPSPKCRKFMLVEDRDLNKVVQCLLCKAAIQVGGLPPAHNPTAEPSWSLPASPPPKRK
jgi:hypothetical protein